MRVQRAGHVHTYTLWHIWTQTQTCALQCPINWIYRGMPLTEAIHKYDSGMSQTEPFSSHLPLGQNACSLVATMKFIMFECMFVCSHVCLVVLGILRVPECVSACGRICVREWRCDVNVCGAVLPFCACGAAPCSGRASAAHLERGGKKGKRKHWRKTGRDRSKGQAGARKL